MIRPPDFRGAAFGSAVDGDAKQDAAARHRMSTVLGIADAWATTHQVHGTVVRRASAPGHLGDGDGLVTDRPGLPIAVVTADCLPVIIESDEAVGIAHAGWRGALAGVVGAVRGVVAQLGTQPRRAAIGPAIGPCCYEVGPEVAARFPGHVATTTWGTASVDLAGWVAAELADLDVWQSRVCTMCGDGYHSFRRDGTKERQTGVAWLPTA